MKDLSEYYLHCENGKELFEGDCLDVYYGYFADRVNDEEELYDGIEPISLSCEDYIRVKQGSYLGAVNPISLLLNSLVSC